MNRYPTKREGARQATNEICPKIRKKLERSKDLQRNYICEWRDGAAFEVRTATVQGGWLILRQ